MDSNRLRQRIMELTAEREQIVNSGNERLRALNEEIQTKVQERDKLLQIANQTINQLNGRIAQLEELLDGQVAQMEVEDELPGRWSENGKLEETIA